MHRNIETNEKRFWQIFEAVGLDNEVIDKCFVGTPSRIGGATFAVLAEEALTRHKVAFEIRHCDSRILQNPGFFHWRSGGEKHINEPDSIAALQEATKYGLPEAYSKYVQASMAAIRDCTLRGRLYIKESKNPIDISEVRLHQKGFGIFVPFVTYYT